MADIVFAAINHVQTIKKYEKVIGLGICYGAFIFAKAQAIAEEHNLPSFDKLILDGCWTSLNDFIAKVKTDPQLINNPQRGGASDEVKWLFSKNIVSGSIVGGLQSYLGVDMNGGNLLPLMPKIKKAQILFFYGKDDLTIDRKQFEKLWDLTVAKKMGIITSNPHVHNHLRSKELYKLITELFIENENIETTLEQLAKPELLSVELSKKFAVQLKSVPLNYVPKKVEKAQPGFIDYIMSYKLPALFFGALYFAYKKGKVKLETVHKLAKIYGVYKFISFTARPALKLISKL